MREKEVNPVETQTKRKHTLPGSEGNSGLAAEGLHCQLTTGALHVTDHLISESRRRHAGWFSVADSTQLGLCGGTTGACT